MTEELTPGKRLYKTFMAWQEAEGRKAMAQQTLQGAERDAFEKNARFYGQIEFVAGGPCSWKVDAEKEEITLELLPEPPKSEAKIVELPRASDAGAPAGPEPEAAATDGAESAESAEGYLADGSPVPE